MDDLSFIFPFKSVRWFLVVSTNLNIFRGGGGGGEDCFYLEHLPSDKLMTEKAEDD